MKRFLLIFAILPMLLMGCAKNDADRVDSGDDGVKFLPSTYADNITEYLWAGGDKVAVYMVTLDDNINSTGTEFAEYGYVAITQKLEATVSANALKVPNERSVHFVSYTPYNGTQITKSGDLMTVNTNVQTQYKDIDLLFSDDQKLYNKLINTDVKLTYDHMMSKIVLRFSSVDPSKLTELKANPITIKGMPNQVKFNLVTKAYSDLAEHARDVLVTSAVSVTPPDAAVAVYEAIVVPQPDGWITSDRRIEFGTGSAKSRYFSRKDLFMKGMKYIYNVDLDDSKEVVFDKPSVVEWGDGGANLFDKNITPLFTDPVFEKWVQDEFCGGRSVIYLSDVKDVKTIRIHKSELHGNTVINNLDGLEAFYSLDTLDVSNYTEANGDMALLGFGIERANLNNNSLLRVAWVMGNQLTELDVSSNYRLLSVSCSYNQLTKLDVSKNPELVNISVGSNKLSVLDISNNRKLVQLAFGYGDNISSIDLSNAPELEYLTCQNNNLISLDVSKNPKLTELVCDPYYAASLNLYNNIELTRLHCGTWGGGAKVLSELILPRTNKITYLTCDGGLLKSLDLSTHYDITKITTLAFQQNPGNGDSSGNVIPADFVVKLPAETDLTALPSVFTQIQPWIYQFSDAAGTAVGVPFNVNTVYTK